MKTLLKSIEGITETKNIFANISFIVVISFIAITLIAVAIKIITNPETIQISNW